jgi:hypothetical protein
MNGFNVPAQQGFAPFQMLPPEVLAQLAAANFKPPQPMAAPGMQMMGMGQQQPAGPGISLGEGMGMLGHGLDFLTGMKYRSDPVASAMYGSERPAYPAYDPGYGHGYGVRGGV